MNILCKTLAAFSRLIYTANGLANSEAVFKRKLAQAERGDLQAQYDIGYRYEKGRGVEEDLRHRHSNGT